jgi:hypothetical protein
MVKGAHVRHFISVAAVLMVLAVLAALVASGFTGEGTPQGAQSVPFQLVAQTAPGGAVGNSGADEERRLERRPRPFGKKRRVLLRRARAQVHNFVGTYHMFGDHGHRAFLDSAERELRRAVSEDPDWYLPHDNLGDALSYAGKQREAIDSYDEALERFERTPPRAPRPTRCSALARGSCSPAAWPCCSPATARYGIWLSPRSIPSGTPSWVGPSRTRISSTT